MLFSLLSGGDIKLTIISILLTLPVVLIALSFHEASHAFVAHKLGDRTAYNLGRMTFNPLKHIDPIGFLCMLVFGYGWAKPVPINTRNFKNPRRGMALTAIAGPISNLLLGAISAVLFAIVSFMNMLYAPQLATMGLMSNVMNVLMIFFYFGGMMNFTLAVFNMIPLPPFDGSRFFSLFLPKKWYFSIMKYERYTMIIVLVISMLCTRIFNFSPFSFVANKLFYAIVRPILNLLLQSIF
ncbi:MAG: site-2 protease family protein [Ruminococcaceae bacterium]|nr:site-2 protease family protein [Oscillospiraceae bacterium]